MQKILWNDLNHRTRCQIALETEPNFIRSMLDSVTVTLSEDQIQEIENGIRTGDDERVKVILYDQLLDCIFNNL
tara:strand:+ start:2217 stop:2438 length:222 start_codon:yes stop_codon:yes gene_type:complete